MSNVNLIYFTVATYMIVALAHGSSSAVLNGDQRIAAISELKEQLGNELFMGFMKEDYWLDNWLNQHNFDVQDTLQSVRKNLQFRKEHNIAQILNEDWTELRAKFPYSRDTFDKSGQPILYYDVEDWDLASFLSSDPSAHNQFLRYMQMMQEDSEAHVRQLRAEGRDIRQYSHIINVGGFSVSKHASIECTKVAHDSDQRLASYAPVNIHRTVLVNVPHFFKAIYSMMTVEGQNNVELYGQDKSQWEETLLEFVDRDQFPQGLLNELVQKDNSEGVLIWNKEL